MDGYEDVSGNVDVDEDVEVDVAVSCICCMGLGDRILGASRVGLSVAAEGDRNQIVWV